MDGTTPSSITAAACANICNKVHHEVGWRDTIADRFWNVMVALEHAQKGFFPTIQNIVRYLDGADAFYRRDYESSSAK